MNKSENRRK